MDNYNEVLKALDGWHLFISNWFKCIIETFFILLYYNRIYIL